MITSSCGGGHWEEAIVSLILTPCVDPIVRIKTRSRVFIMGGWVRGVGMLVGWRRGEGLEKTHFWGWEFGRLRNGVFGNLEGIVFVHTMLKIPVPVSLTEVKQHEAWLVLR